MLRGKNFAYPNFQYLLLDEVQNVSGWDVWVGKLFRRGYDTEKSLFYYHSRNDKETDFVVREGNKVKQLIQVCYEMPNEKTEKREVGSLVECAGELKCDNLTIVTWNEEWVIEKNGYVVKVVPVEKF